MKLRYAVAYSEGNPSPWGEGRVRGNGLSHHATKFLCHRTRILIPVFSTPLICIEGVFVASKNRQNGARTFLSAAMCADMGRDWILAAIHGFGESQRTGMSALRRRWPCFPAAAPVLLTLSGH